MDLKKKLLTLSLSAAVLAPMAAFAEHQGGRFGTYHHEHTSACRHDGRYVPPPPPTSSQQQGRYELRDVQQWVDGQYTQIWVPEQCVARGRRGRHVRCVPAHYESRWVEGHYVTVQQWVFVPYFRPHVQVTARW